MEVAQVHLSLPVLRLEPLSATISGWVVIPRMCPTRACCLEQIAANVRTCEASVSADLTLSIQDPRVTGYVRDRHKSWAFASCLHSQLSPALSS